MRLLRTSEVACREPQPLPFRLGDIPMACPWPGSSSGVQGLEAGGSPASTNSMLLSQGSRYDSMICLPLGWVVGKRWLTSAQWKRGVLQCVFSTMLHNCSLRVVQTFSSSASERKGMKSYRRKEATWALDTCWPAEWRAGTGWHYTEGAGGHVFHTKYFQAFAPPSV